MKALTAAQQQDFSKLAKEFLAKQDGPNSDDGYQEYERCVMFLESVYGQARNTVDVSAVGEPDHVVICLYEQAGDEEPAESFTLEV